MRYVTRNPAPHVVFAGGGTGGHLYPGLAVAAELRREVSRAQVTVAGSGLEFERLAVAEAGFDYLPLACRPFKRSAAGAVRLLRENLVGYQAAVRYLRANPADVVVGLGGYVSVPMARAAISRRVPLVLLEQNASPGRATSWLAPSATLVCGAFEEMRPRLRARGPVRITGNPIRSGFVEPDQDVSGVVRRKRLVVLGGSQGSQSLNESVPRAMYRLRSRLAGWEIIHQAGPRQAEATRELYRKLGLAARVTSFVKNMPRLLSGAHLAVSRAGGTTLAELAAAGVPAVLVPYPHAADDHQRKNAAVLVDAGACRVVDERDSSDRLDNRLADSLSLVMFDPRRRASMSVAINGRARPDAAWHVANMVRALCHDRPRFADVA